MRVIVAHDGEQLPPSVASLVFGRARDNERAAVEGGAAPVRLLAAQELIESMGGTLTQLTGSSRPGLRADLPRASVQLPHESGRREPAALVTA